MTVLEQAAGTQVAVVGTEHILAETGGAVTLPPGNAFTLHVDCNAMAAGDVLELRWYGKAKTGGTVREYDVQTITDVPASGLFVSVPFPTPVYAKATLKQTAGTARSFDWSVVAL